MAKRTRKPALIAALTLLAASLAYLTSWPVAVDPIAWQAPPAPALTGEWAPNDALAEPTILALPEGEEGPEDLHEIDGYIYTGTVSGHILRWPAAGGPAEQIADTGGRPLGLHADAQGRLLIADAFAGLLRLEADGTLTTLCTHADDGSPLLFTDDLDVAQDGSIWFTDASTHFDLHHWKQELFESRGNGRLLRWLPDSDGANAGCELVQSGLFFANGVALAPDDSFVLINETSRYRVRRRWLSGPRAGEDEVFIDNLPGFPDGISRGDDDLFWIAIASPRNALLDAVAGHPFLRKVIVRLPKAAQPGPIRHPFVIAVDGRGQVLRTLQDPKGGALAVTTSAQQHGERLYLGSLGGPVAGWVSPE